MHQWYIYGHHTIYPVDIDKLKMVQRQSARFKKDRYASVTNMTDFSSLQSRRTDAKLVMLYNIIVDVDDILMPATCHYTHGYLLQPYTRVDANKYSYLIGNQTLCQKMMDQ